MSPPDAGGGTLHIRSARMNLFLNVIASTAKQSILSLLGEMHCFAALAMTVSASECQPPPPGTARNTAPSIIFLSAMQNLDLNNSKFRSNIFSRVHSME
jgi:hypothetical protein